MSSAAFWKGFPGRGVKAAPSGLAQEGGGRPGESGSSSTKLDPGNTFLMGAKDGVRWFSAKG